MCMARPLTISRAQASLRVGDREERVQDDSIKMDLGDILLPQLTDVLQDAISRLEAADISFGIMGGLAVATLLTLLFLPALYASWYGARRPA
jgi:hypothetical protein